MQRIIINIASTSSDLESNESLLLSDGENVISCLEENLYHFIQDIEHSEFFVTTAIIQWQTDINYFRWIYDEIVQLNPAVQIICISDHYNLLHPLDMDRYSRIYTYIKTGNKKYELPVAMRNINEYLELKTGTLEMNAKMAFIQKRHEEEILKATQKLEDRLASKNRFISILAHDLKASFNSLIGFSDILITDFEKLDYDSKLRFIAKIKNLSENTFKLLKNILNWNTIQKGGLKKKLTHFNLQRFTSDIKKLYDTQAKGKNIAIHLVIPSHLKICADIDILSTILRNLLNNAIKFTPVNGEIIIRGSQHEEYTQIVVEDTGIGIHPDNMQKIFNADEKFTTRGTAKELGTGFGLSICKEMVELHNGKMLVESTVGEGTKFTIQIPIAVHTQVSPH